ncbi:MAG: hypothetical protein JKX83_02215 [Pseudomonadales bacterium]|nr:hypothetical protein [Pseudomonadales bacterium]
MDDEGREHTKGIYGANSVLAPAAPAAIDNPVNFNIESYSDTQVLTATYSQVRSYLESVDLGAVFT